MNRRKIRPSVRAWRRKRDRIARLLRSLLLTTAEVADATGLRLDAAYRILRRMRLEGWVVEVSGHALPSTRNRVVLWGLA